MFASVATFALISQTAAAPAVSLARLKTFDQFRVVALASAPSGSKVAFATEDGTVRIFDAKAMATAVALKGHPDQVMAVAFSADGTKVATGDARARIWIWDAKTGNKLRELPRDRGHLRPISALAFSRDNQRLASVGADDVLLVWKVGGGNPVGRIAGTGANFYGVAWTATGGIVTGTLLEGARLYNGQTYQLAATMTLPGGQGANGIGLGATGTFVTAGRDGRLTLWDLAKRARVAGLQGHSDWVVNAAVTPNGRYAVSGSTDRTVRLWDLKGYKTVQTIEDQSFVGAQVAFTADGRYLVTTSSSDALQVWSVTPPQAAPVAQAKPTRRRR
jgi:WD40 repeat protein